MTTETLEPVVERQSSKSDTPKGRPADLLACAVATFSAIFATVVSLIFFLGFAANDNVFAGLVSAFAFSAFLGAFASVPSVIIAVIAWRAWKQGLKRAQAVWTLLLSTPWIALSLLALMKTPLPYSLTLFALLCSLLLTAWAFISIILGPSRNFEVK